MSPEASHFALQLLRGLVPCVLNKAKYLLKKLFSRQQEATISLERERTVTVKDRITIKVTADFAASGPKDLQLDGEKLKQLVKSLLDAERH
jgi:hypothetical protein